MPPTTTTDELLADIGRRIDRLDAGTHAAAADVRIAARRRVAVLRIDEAAIRAAAQDAVACLEHSVRDLDARVDVAERSGAADLAGDLGAFLDAVIAELRAWDVYLERRQLNAARTGRADRERAEAAISELRRCANAVRKSVADAHPASGEARRDGRRRVQAARDELEGRAARLEAALTGREAV